MKCRPGILFEWHSSRKRLVKPHLLNESFRGSNGTMQLDACLCHEYLPNNKNSNNK